MERRDPIELCRLVFQERWKRKHILAAVGQFGEEYVADSLLQPFIAGEPVEGSYLEQKIIARMLFDVRPKPSYPLAHIIESCLPRWNLSTEEFAFYLEAVFGRTALIETLRRVEGSRSPEGHERRSVDVIRYFLRIEADEKAAQPGATDNPDDAERLREDH